MKVLLEEKRKIILALLMGAALLFFAVIMYNTYDAYTNMWWSSNSSICF